MSTNCSILFSNHSLNGSNDLYNIWTTGAAPTAYGLVADGGDPNGTVNHSHPAQQQQQSQHQQHYETTTLYTPPTSASSLGMY